MKIQSITENKYITPKTTGYGALTALGVATVSGISKNKTLRKLHKPSAITTAILSLAHLALIEYYHYKWKNASSSPKQL